MTAVHGKDYYVSIDAVNYTAQIKTSSWEQTPGIHDITGSGTDDQSFRGGQVGRTFTMGGWYDDTDAVCPSNLEDLAGETVEMIRRPQGTGTGKPETTCNVVVGKYVESQKNDDITQWTCDFTVTGAVVKTTQA